MECLLFCYGIEGVASALLALAGSGVLLPAVFWWSVQLFCEFWFEILGFYVG